MEAPPPLYFLGSPELQRELSRLLSQEVVPVHDDAEEACTLIAESTARPPLQWLACRPRARLLLCCQGEPSAEWLQLTQLQAVYLPPLDLQEVARSLGARPTPDPAFVAARVWKRNRHVVEQSLQILEGSDRALARLHAHRLAGSLGSFGLQRASQVARQIEEMLVHQPDPAYQPLLATLRQLIEAGPEDTDPVVEPGSLRRLQVLALVGEPRAELKNLAQELDVELLETSSLEQAQRWVAERNPELVLVQTDHPQFCQWTSVLQQYHDFAQDHLAMFWVSEQAPEVSGQLAHCFRNLRVGPEFQDVLAELRRQISWLRRQMFQVAVVDDDEVALTAVKYVLQGRRIQVSCWDDPLEFWRERHQIACDLIILDLDMPRLSGYEICRALRQDPHFQDRAIFMLTAHNEPETVTRLFRVGADDFVAKPFLGPELRSRVQSRLERFRLLARLIQTDTLTGLLNRRKAQQNLEHYLNLARRQQQPLSLALIDVDHFKKFNDEFGHAQGDEVLRALAQRLREWFRQEDVVARWGGEEFLVAMYGIEGQPAAQRLNSLLQELVKSPLLPQLPRVTFSAGVCELFGEASALDAALQLADERLYAAKKAGRARVMGALVASLESHV